MKLISRSVFLRRAIASVAISSTFALQLFAQAAAPARSAASLAPAESELAEKITVASIKEMTGALSSPEMEGRGTGQPGGDKAANWIAEKFKALGLKPLGDKGSYLQKVDFRETVMTEASFQIGETSLEHGTEFGFAPMGSSSKDVSGEIVFVSYGLQLKTNNVDMLAGQNLQGKVVVVTQGPAPGITKKQWDDAKVWSMIRRNILDQGAAALVVIGNGSNEDQPDEAVTYFSRRQITMPNEEGAPAGYPPLIYVTAKGAEKIFAAAGKTLKETLEQGNNPQFKATNLKVKAKLTAKYKNAKVSASNVVGYLEGSDPSLKAEAVLFSAHYDAYGSENGKVYLGAADNALGTAEMLSVAEAFSKLEKKPRRSMVFLAVTGEEYGLYGSKYWAKDPTWDVKKVAANLNLDGIGSEVYGPVKTMVGYGAEHSSLGTILENVAKSYEINVIPDPMPDEKVFYRSDHYSFVERGIPSLMLLGAPAGDKEVWMKRIKDWEKVDYHQPGDSIQPGWAWEGAVSVAEVMAIMGWRISETDAMPNWIPSSRFGKLERGNTKDLPEEK